MTFGVVVYIEDMSNKLIVIVIMSIIYKLEEEEYKLATFDNFYIDMVDEKCNLEKIGVLSLGNMHGWSSNVVGNLWAWGFGDEGMEVIKENKNNGGVGWWRLVMMRN